MIGEYSEQSLLVVQQAIARCARFRWLEGIPVRLWYVATGLPGMKAGREQDRGGKDGESRIHEHGRSPFDSWRDGDRVQP